MIKCDPSQTKAVVVLLTVLAGAIVWTFLRIGGGPRQQVAATQASAAVAQVESGTVTVVPAFEPSRNPFRKPAAVRGVRDSRSGVGSGVIVREGYGQSFESARINPMPLPGVSATVTATPERTDSAQSGQQQPEMPHFELLATVGGPDGITAVIRCGESSPRVVAEGDVLDGGFKVQKLEADRAVLIDGRDTVVVKRPSG